MTFCEVERPALVLGSTQASADVDEVATSGAGVEVARRRSGGGAVLVEPGRTVWADIVVPTGDALWEPDVGRAFWWLGQAWAAALASLGIAGARFHRGPLVSSPWSSLVCFAGLGPGEVCVGGTKVIGISQRRVREGALFQCAVALVWDPAAMPALLALDGAARADLEADARHFATSLIEIAAVTPHQVEGALLSHLPPPGSMETA